MAKSKALAETECEVVEIELKSRCLAVYCQPGSTGTVQAERTVKRSGSGHLLRTGSQRLYGLPLLEALNEKGGGTSPPPRF